MQIKYYNKGEEGVEVQLVIDFEAFCSIGICGLKVLERLARDIGCTSRPGEHGPETYFFRTEDGSQVFASGIIQFTDLINIKLEKKIVWDTKLDFIRETSSSDGLSQSEEK